MGWIRRWHLGVSALVFTLSVNSARSSEEIGAVDAVVGLPQFISGEMQYFLTNELHLGVGYGFFPIDGILQKKVKLGTFNLGSSFEVTPKASYSLNTISAFARYFPGSSSGSKGGFFIQFMYAYLNANSDISGNLDLVGSISIPNALQGTMSITQHLFGILIGNETTFGQGSNFFFDIAGGIAYKTRTVVSTEISANTQAISSILPQAQQNQLNSSIAGIKSQVEDSLNSYNKIPILPLGLVALGARF